MLVNKALRGTLTDIVDVIHKHGKTRVGPVLIALQPLPPPPVLPSVDL